MFKFRSVVATVLAVVLVSPLGLGAQAARFPAGPYTETCTDIQVYGPNLSAQCQRDDGVVVPAGITLFIGRGEILNCDGVLRTVPCPLPQSELGPVLQPGELCRDYGDLAIPTFEDAIVESAVRGASRIGDEDALSCALISGLRSLGLSGNISSLVGVQNLTGLTFLYNMSGGTLTNLDAIAGMTGLKILQLPSQQLTDISALRELTGLEGLYLDRNFRLSEFGPIRSLINLSILSLTHTNMGLEDIQMLLDNPGLGEGDEALLSGDCADFAILIARGVRVYAKRGNRFETCQGKPAGADSAPASTSAR